MLRFTFALLCALPLFASAQDLPRPDHVVIVIEENRHYSQIIGNPAAPYLNQLAKEGLLFTQYFGVTHPSQPNYLALFSGSLQGVNDNQCPHEFNSDNLASALLDKGYSLVSYADSLPRTGDTSCISGAYFRKHNPIANWPALRELNQPFTAFPIDFSKLPSVSLIIPDMRHDMHDGTVAEGDAWLRANLEAYRQWAMTHHSLLIVLWDEDDYSADNRVPMIWLGQGIKAGENTQRSNHYGLLRTLEEWFGLPYLGASAQAVGIKP
jgi:phosphatidylinositol-3-phosphatase